MWRGPKQPEAASMTPDSTGVRRVPITSTRLQRTGPSNVSGTVSREEAIAEHSDTPTSDVVILPPIPPAPSDRKVTPVSPVEALGQAQFETEQRVSEVVAQVRAALSYDESQLELLLDALVSYQQFLRAQRIGATMLRRAHTGTVLQSRCKEVCARLWDCTELVQDELVSLVANPERLLALVDKLESAANATHVPETRQTRACELAERAAILRAKVKRAEYRLYGLSHPTVRQRSLRQQLQKFRALDELPFVPKDRAAEELCISTLQELEPLFARLESELDYLLESLPQATSPTGSLSESGYPAGAFELTEELVELSRSAQVDDATLPGEEADMLVSAHENPEHSDQQKCSEVAAEVSVTLPKLEAESVDVFDDSQSILPVDERTTMQSSPPLRVPTTPDFVADNRAVPPTSESDESLYQLGVYELQRGDSLSDILYGESGAGMLPGMYEVDATHERKLVYAVREYLDEYEYVRSYIGFPVGDNQWWIERGSHSTISLDRLNDAVMYVGAQYRYISLPRPGREQLRQQFAPLEQQKTYLDSAPRFSPQRVRVADEQRPLDQLFAGVATWLSPAPSAMSPKKKIKPVKQQDNTVSYTESASNQVIPKWVIELEGRAVNQQYGDNEIAYQRDRTQWFLRSLFGVASANGMTSRIFGVAASDPDAEAALVPLLRMSVAQWQHFRHHPTERYEWMMQHGIRPSNWNQISLAISRWHAIGTVRGVVAEATPVAVLGRAAFAAEHTQANKV